ncbi:MAG: inositol 2-dehydrogenase [Candidatus Lokiarchaeota archaeon]|nr:inositol 2-dehydrogenase [Candidatus Lokiarchaeota archaeon]MBD3343397.1 inositol 2-dehydrogenase [Candidatus Lokiarchaeota archaeon]
MEKISVAVIGAGRIGKIHIRNLSLEIPNVKLKTVADIQFSEELRNELIELGVQNLTTDVESVFEDSDINAILIASSTDTHSEYIQKAAKKNKHVFCEKPLDVNIKRIEETLSIVEKEGISLMIGFNRRFDHNFRRVHEAVENGQVGNPQIVKITSRDPAPPPIEYISVSGGIFIDMTIHDWDMARFLSGSEVTEVYATGEVLIDPKIGEAGDVDTAVAVLKFKNGAMALIDNTRQAVYGYDQRVEVFGSKGCVVADNESTNTVRIYTAECTNIDKIPYFFLERYMNSYATELRYFFECLRKNKKPLPNGMDGLQNVKVAIAAQKSLEENRPVNLSEIS